MTELDRMEHGHSLLSAASRYDRLRLRDHERTGYESLAPDEAAEARMLAGNGGDAQDD
jgi:hypothetical protein